MAYFTMRNIYNIFLSKIDNYKNQTLSMAIKGIFNNSDYPIFGKEDWDDEEDCVYFGLNKSYEAIQELTDTMGRHQDPSDYDGIFEVIACARESINQDYKEKRNKINAEHDKNYKEKLEMLDSEYNDDLYLYLSSSKELANFFMARIAKHEILRVISNEGKKYYDKMMDKYLTEADIEEIKKLIVSYLNNFKYIDSQISPYGF